MGQVIAVPGSAVEITVPSSCVWRSSDLCWALCWLFALLACSDSVIGALLAHFTDESVGLGEGVTSECGWKPVPCGRAGIEIRVSQSTHILGNLRVLSRISSQEVLIGP